MIICTARTDGRSFYPTFNGTILGQAQLDISKGTPFRHILTHHSRHLRLGYAQERWSSALPMPLLISKILQSDDTTYTPHTCRPRVILRQKAS